MARDKHFKKYQAGKHTSVGNRDGGACLTGHKSKYTKSDSCSYRWQAKEESKASRTSVYDKDPQWKDVKKDVHANREDARKGTPDGFLGTSSYWTKRRRLYPGGYAQKIAMPNKGDWYVGGPTKDRSLRKASGRGYVAKGKNFEHVLWPYWNNAHHLIPKGTLKAQIEHKGITTRCQKLIKGALLKAKYNVNRHVNVILLPMDKEVGIVLGLPRHLILEDESTVVEQSPKFDHKAYNNTVETELRKIVDQYKEKAQPEADKDCVSPSFTLTKTQLERLSKRCYDAVVGAAPGRPISEITSLPPFSES
jgi:hypothetical protein